MEQLVEFVNKLQDVFTISGCTKINLPQVVVVGSQSSGKSSVLEHLVGRSFLPRGSGLVTRCPLILQMSKVETDEYGIFQHDPEKVYKDYSLITKEIENQTLKLAGDNKGIVNHPITLKLFSPHFIDLTLVDLPGITKVAVGDQPNNIEEQIRNLIKEYVSNPNSIILAISQANMDMANSDSLKLSREVDPDGNRTLAVVTMLDIMDAGTNATEMLSGRVIPVKLGIIGVVNRSQKNVERGQSIEVSLLEEEIFLSKNYPEIAHCNGTAYLKKTVQKILIKHIQDCMPQIKESILMQLSTCEDKLSRLGDSKFDKTTLLLDLLIKFFNAYRSTMDGDNSEIVSLDICGGAKITNIFLITFNTALSQIVPLQNITQDKMLTAMRNSTGVRPAIVSERAFERLVKIEIGKLREPCLNCVDNVLKELIEIVQYCLKNQPILSRFDKLKYKISDFVTNELEKQIPITKDTINNLIDVHMGYINKSHPHFINKINTLKNQTIKSSWNSSYEDYRMIVDLVTSYFAIVKTIIEDAVPKVIMQYLIDYSLNKLQPLIIEKLYGSETANLLEESNEVLEKRERLEKDMEALKQAKKILNRMEFFNKE